MCDKIEKTDFIEAAELFVLGTVGPKPELYPPGPTIGVVPAGGGCGYIPGVDGVKLGTAGPPAELHICKTKAAHCYAP